MYVFKKKLIVSVVFFCCTATASMYLSGHEKKSNAIEQINLSKSIDKEVLVTDKKIKKNEKEPVENPKIVWTATVSENGFSATTPVLHKNIVLFSGDRELSCLEKTNGNHLWSVKGKFYHSRPAVWKNKVIAVEDKGLQIIDLKTGNIDHFIDLTTPKYLKFLADSNPIIQNDDCYLGTRSNHLVKIDLNLKKVIWRSPEQETSVWTPALESGFAVASIWEKSLCVFETKNGSLLWKKDLPGIGVYPPIIQNGIVLCAGSLQKKEKQKIQQEEDVQEHKAGNGLIRTSIIPRAPKVGLVKAFRLSDGRLLWTKKIEDTKDQSCLGLLGTKKGLIVGTKSQVFSLNPNTGKLKWRYPHKKFGHVNYFVDELENLYLGTDESKFIMLGLGNGKERLVCDLMDIVDDRYKNLRHRTRNGVASQDCGACSTPIVENNYAYVVTTGGLAICIDLP